MTISDKENNQKISEMLEVINTCIKENKLTFLANLICSLQRDYEEVCTLATMGEYKTSWTHKMVMDYLTFECNQ
jgi:hypothetical protein